MNTARKIKSDLWYIGASDRRLALFENIMPVPQGVSYNSYLLMDDKTVLLDSVDHAVAPQFLENLTAVLAGRPLDYIVVHHVEPDHLASLQEVLVRHPQAVILCSMQASRLIPQFFQMPETCAIQTVKEGETLETGHHTLTFFAAPMVHWPEVLVSYDTADKILFSADAFGTFGALNGNLYADELNFDRDWLDDARRYCTNIVGKYGVQVQNLLKKAATLDIQMICPLHGPIWRENLGYFIQKYDLWSRYEPEDKDGVVLIYGSMYGHTESAAQVLAGILADKGVRDVKMYDVSVTHVSYLLSETFRCGRIVLLAPTYNNGLYPPMENYLLDVQAHFVQDRTFALVENGSWSPIAAKSMQELIQNMKPNNIEGPVVTLKSSMKEEQRQELEKLAENLLN
ncbi:MAG: FprA family A-type flavoprotein [Bacteroidales bacterium]|nr:FprA family A-type flavoprotein [Bacteroidales bacterium]